MSFRQYSKIALWKIIALGFLCVGCECSRSTIVMPHVKENQKQLEICPYSFTFLTNKTPRPLEYRNWGRNSSGNALYTCSYNRIDDITDALVFLSNGETRNRPFLGEVFFYVNEAGEPTVVGRRKGNVIDVTSSFSVSVTNYPRVSVDPNGRYLMISDYGGASAWTRIYSLEMPPKEVLALDERVYDVFSGTNGDIHLIMDTPRTQIVWRVYHKQIAGYNKIDEHVITKRRCGAIVTDVDCETRRLLFQTLWDVPISFLNAVYVYDAETDKTHRVGMDDNAWFLTHDVFARKD